MRTVKSFEASHGSRLFVCATPIGNLSDVSQRLNETLRSVAVIAAEDTRQTQKLLNHLDIHGVRTVSYHEHSPGAREDELLQRLRAGDDVALVSDAGTPCVSDPGVGLIRRAIDAGIPIVPIPGPTAAITALVASGLAMDRFTFIGFLSRVSKVRTEQLGSLKHRPETLLFYEAPHRLRATLRALMDVFGENRQVVLARELTKRHEEFAYGTLREAHDQCDVQEPRGEYVVIVEGYTGDPELAETDDHNPWEGLSAAEHVQQLVETGLTQKEAIKSVAIMRNRPKREIYEQVHVRRNNE